MASFITTLYGKPAVLNGYSFRGFMWDGETGKPIIDREAYARLDTKDRVTLDRLLQNIHEGPLHNIIEARSALLALRDEYTRLASQQRPLDEDQRRFVIYAKTLLRGKGIQKKTQEALDFRREHKRAFYHFNALLHSSIARKCMVRTPSTKALPYKLALGIYEFDRKETELLCSNVPALVKLGKFNLLKALQQADLIDEIDEKDSSISGLDKITGGLDTAAALYGIQPKSLKHLIAFWGGEERFFAFVERRAAWRRTSIKKELIWLNKIKLPRTEAYDKSLWQELYNKQMKKAYNPSEDLMVNYSSMDTVEADAREQHIALQRFAFDSIFALAVDDVHYPDEHENPGLAQVCKIARYPNRVFCDAKRTMANVCSVDLIPNVYIDGDDIGLPKFELLKLPKDDPMILAVGTAVYSCSNIGSECGKEMVRAAATKDFVGVYVMRRKGCYWPDGRAFPQDLGRPSLPNIVKLTAWLTEEDRMGKCELVLNEWRDNLGLHDTDKVKVLNRLGEEIMKADRNIRGVYLGYHGIPLFPSVDNSEGILLPRDPSIAIKKDIQRVCIICEERPSIPRRQIKPVYTALAA